MSGQFLVSAAKLDTESLAFFNSLCQLPFSRQAVAFLNAYWSEVGDQAEFIQGCAWKIMKYSDMHAKGIDDTNRYHEGNDLDFDEGLHFYETLCKNLEGGQEDEFKVYSGDKYALSQPEMLTSIARKKELRDKIDVNFDTRISMLEYLLYQYKSVADQSDFIVRSMKAPDEHPEIKKSRLALEEVNQRIKKYESEKARLEDMSLRGGVQGLSAKAHLMELDGSTLREDLNSAIIIAESAVSAISTTAAMTEGALWWMQEELATVKGKYGSK